MPQLPSDLQASVDTIRAAIARGDFTRAGELVGLQAQLQECRTIAAAKQEVKALEAEIAAIREEINSGDFAHAAELSNLQTELHEKQHMMAAGGTGSGGSGSNGAQSVSKFANPREDLQASVDATLLKPTPLADMSVSVPLEGPEATLLVIACELHGLGPEHFLDVMVEARNIQNIWGEGACLIMFNKTPDEVCHRINREGSQISMVHFVGHGDLVDGNRYNLAFSDAQGRQVTSEQTGSLSLLQFYTEIIHKKKRKLELVFLNGCQVPPYTHTLYIHS
jgi:hypothetical protein